MKNENIAYHIRYYVHFPSENHLLSIKCLKTCVYIYTLLNLLTNTPLAWLGLQQRYVFIVVVINITRRDISRFRDLAPPESIHIIRHLSSKPFGQLHKLLHTN